MTTNEAELAGLTRAIREEPDADDLRHILADLLRDSDDPAERARGEFVRASLALSALPVCEKFVEHDCASCRAFIVADAAGRRTFGDDDDPTACVMPGPGMRPQRSSVVLGYWRGLPEVWAVADVPTFEREALAVFSAHPIRRVVLRCDVQSPIGLNPPWVACDDCSPGLWDLLGGENRGGLKFYYTHDIARADLESSCVWWARGLCGLPALPRPRPA